MAPSKQPEARREARKKYYETNKEKIRAQQKAYRLINRGELAEKKKLYGATYRLNNKEKLRGKQRVYQLTHPEVGRRAKMKYLYGIRVEDYQKMFDAQSGRCAICNSLSDNKESRLNIDHCHETGTIRGLLCWPCNAALGLLKDNTGTLLNAVVYLNQIRGCV